MNNNYFTHRENCAHKDDNYHRVPIECTDKEGYLLCECHKKGSPLGDTIEDLRSRGINRI